MVFGGFGSGLTSKNWIFSSLLRVNKLVTMELKSKSKSKNLMLSPSNL
jgi:hypothetical protein